MEGFFFTFLISSDFINLNRGLKAHLKEDSFQTPMLLRGKALCASVPTPRVNRNKQRYLRQCLIQLLNR